jgi:membrane dipeptidase
VHNQLRDFKFNEDLRSVAPWSKSAWSHTDLLRLRRGMVGGQVRNQRCIRHRPALQP